MSTRMTRLLLACLMAGVALVAVACGPEEVTATPAVASPDPGTLNSVSPLESPIESPVPPATGEVERPACLTLIQPAGNTVCGYVIRENTGEPVVGRPVYLAEGLFASDNSVVFAALDQQNAPRGVTDEQGMFYVTEVPDNLYFLMIDDYPSPVMLTEPDVPTNDLMVDWRDTGGAVDLGVITTNLLTPDQP
ncbi:MAG: hypothetical protein GX620_14150 [Chloroflexi bacterium]|nr:hypothetical protein [Chloroflexota bacterium]